MQMIKLLNKLFGMAKAIHEENIMIMHLIALNSDKDVRTFAFKIAGDFERLFDRYFKDLEEEK